MLFSRKTCLRRFLFNSIFRRSFSFQCFFFSLGLRQKARRLKRQQAQQGHHQPRVFIRRQAQFSATMNHHAVEQLRFIRRHLLRQLRNGGVFSILGIFGYCDFGSSAHSLQYGHFLQHPRHILQRKSG